MKIYGYCRQNSRVKFSPELWVAWTRKRLDVTNVAALRAGIDEFRRMCGAREPSTYGQGPYRIDHVKETKPKRRGGWPRGKKRGPRVKRDLPATAAPW